MPFPERLFARRWQSEIRGESLGGSVEIVEGAMADVAIVMALNLMSGGLGLGLKNLDAFLAFVVFVGKMAVVPHVLRAVPVVVEVLVASEALKIGNAVAGGLPVLVTGAPAAGEAAIAIPAFIHVEAWRDLHEPILALIQATLKKKPINLPADTERLAWRYVSVWLVFPPLPGDDGNV